MSEEGDQAIRDVVKGAGIVYIGLFLELLIAFVAQLLAARYLSVGGFGGLTAGTALLDIGSIVAGLGFASGLTRYLPRLSPGEKGKLAWYTVGITLVTSGMLGVGVTLNADFIASRIFNSPNVAVSIRIFGAAIPFATLLKVSIGGIRGQEKALYRVYIKNIIQPSLRIGLVVAAVTFGLGQAGIAGAYAVPYAISATVALVLLHRSLPSPDVSIDGSLFKEVTQFSLPFTISGVSGFIYRSMDIFLVLYFIGDNATGIYGVAYAAVSFMGMYSTAFNFLGAPIASRLESEGNVQDVMRMFGSIGRWLVIASVVTLVPLGVFATDFISVLYQSKYAAGGPALALLAVGFGAKNLLSIHGPILEAVSWSKALAVNSGVAAITNLLLNLLLIPRFGFFGAAAATVFAFLLRDTLAAAEVYLAVDTIPITKTSLKPLLPGIPFLAVMSLIVAPAVPTTFFWLAGITGLSGIVYGIVTVLMFGLSKTEVMVLRSTEERYGLSFGPLDGVIRYLER